LSTDILRIKGTNVLDRNLKALGEGWRNIVNQGGSGSSKTYSICQAIIVNCYQNPLKHYSVIRATLPDLRKSAMLDFFNILKGVGLYDEKLHNKTDNLYKLNGSTIEFYGLDVGQKVRGARRDYAWLNESNEIDLDSYRQIAMRTRKTLFFDYNPSEQHHWIYDEVLTRKDTKVLYSTYLDNKEFLSEQERNEIEGYKEADENYWRGFGLGLRGKLGSLIYNHWQQCDKLPDGGDVFYGLDFGWSNPAALVHIVLKDNTIYAEEKFYRSHMTDDDIVTELESHCTKDVPIYADTEDPQAIQTIANAGYNIIGQVKGPGSVIAGIREIQKRKYYIVKGSMNMLKEIKGYSFRTKHGDILEEPVKINDHLMDATRGAVYTHLLPESIDGDTIIYDEPERISKY